MIRLNALKLLLLIAVALGLQTSASFSGSTGFYAENPGFASVSYFDLANGNTFVQVTNIDSVDPIFIHVQIFADLNDCVDRDFTDSLTPNETHVYDISNLQSANGKPINFAIPAGSHGFVVISAGDGEFETSSIISNFRIVRNEGYEYRVNSAIANFLFPQISYVARFTDNWGANQADIVGVRVVQDPQNQGTQPDGTFDLSVQITDPHELFVFDDEETGTSCGEAIFGCDERPGDDDNPPDDDDLVAFTPDFINQGINDVFPNTRGGGVLCSGDFNADGFLRLTIGSNAIQGQDVIGFVGLNDGDSRGSMDRFKAVDTTD